MKEAVIVCGILATVFVGDMVGMFVQPWAPWWFGQQGGSTASSIPIDSTGSVPFVPSVPSIPLEPPTTHAGNVSDAERFQLISAAGAPPNVAVIMTAISIAEDGSGNPSAVSAPNTGLAAGTVDIGIWQVNSAHIGQCGIQSQQWLYDPMNNARAAMCILGAKLNYCAWSTYEASCGPGHNSAYRAFLTCAQAIAGGGTCKR